MVLMGVSVLVLVLPQVRARAAQSITTILRKVSGDVFHLLLDYQARWLEGQAEAVARAAAQGVGEEGRKAHRPAMPGGG